MWIKTALNDWIDTGAILAVTVLPANNPGSFYVSAMTAGGKCMLTGNFRNKDAAQNYADDFVSKYLKEDNHVD